MGLLSFFRRKGLTVSPTVVDASISGQLNLYQRLGGVNQQINAAWLQAQSASYAYLYATQPAVRSVVDEIARNTAQLGLKLFQRVSDTERKRDTLHPAALTMAHPNDLTPADKFIWDVVADYLVHDNCYLLKFRTTSDAPLKLIRVPPPAVAIEGTGRYTIEGYRIYRWDGSMYPLRPDPPIPPEDMVHWRGYNPADSRMGVSRLQTLRDILAEETASQTANVELLKSGLSKPGYIKRPIESPDWSLEAQERFREDWARQTKQAASKTPVLEEGMEFADFGITPRDAQQLDGRRFTIEEVCRIYGVPTPIMGLQPPSGRLDLLEAHNEFYADTLAPLVTELACQLDFSILEQEYNEEKFYFTFDIDSKLKGSPEKRFPALTTAAGRPWMTVNEVRAIENLPPVEEGDELTIPSNVALAGQQGDPNAPQLPAPNVMPPQDPNKPPQDGSYRNDSNGNGTVKASLLPRRQSIESNRNYYAGALTQALERHFTRQEASVKSAHKAADDTRADDELAADLLALTKRQVQSMGDRVALRIASKFDMRMTEHYLDAKTIDSAKAINAQTQADIEAVGYTDAYTKAINERAPGLGMSLATDNAAWSTKEAVQQAPTIHLITIDGGDCEICGPYQGTWRFEDLDAWPSYHANCNCIADVS